MFTVYLCVNSKNNYCHEVFDNLKAAQFWCETNVGFHVITRVLRHNQPSLLGNFLAGR